MDQRVVLSASIPATNSITAGINLGLHSLNRVELPADIGTATTATFQVSSDGIDYLDLYDVNGNEYKLGEGTTLVAGGAYPVDPTIFMGVQYVKVRLGTSGTPNTYAAARELTLVAVAF